MKKYLLTAMALLLSLGFVNTIYAEGSNKTEIEFVRIPAGSFRMGDLSNSGHPSEKPVHRVNIKAFYMSKTEVTQAQWDAVMGGNPSKFKGDNNPVDSVSWNNVQNFIETINEQTGKRYRLPSEAEWEYAARAGTTTRYSWGNYAGRNRANYGSEDREECCVGVASGKDRWENTSPVASFAPNAWGLYDMHGNLAEWVEDCWNQDYKGAPSDGSAWKNGDCRRRVARGSSWKVFPSNMRSAHRGGSGNLASDSFNRYGFRLVHD